MTIGLIGLGTMGAGMGQNLLRAGYALKVYNRTASKADSLKAAGAEVAQSPAEAAAEADVVIAMVADDAASREVWLGDDGALSAAKKGAVLVESGTLTQEWVGELAAAAAERGCSLLDAPVTGSRAQAAAGELTFLVGGDEEVLAKALPVLQAMSKKVLHVGPQGSGCRLKLVNNFLCGVQLASLAEAMTWIERSGLNRELAVEALCGGAPGSPLIKTMSQRMVEKQYDVNFLLRLLAKDMRYAETVAAQDGAPLETVKPTISTFERAVQAGFGEKDMSAVVELFRSGER